MGVLKNMIGGIGQYVIFIKNLFVHMESFSTYFKLYITESYQIGYKSMFLFSLVSLFIGAVTLVQTAFNLVSPLIPSYMISLVVRDMTVLELSPTIMGIIFAGKVGSSISSELGTMRITEQVDALEIMGINSVSYLVLPKVLASVTMYPMLVIYSMLLALTGALLASFALPDLTMTDYFYGLQYEFNAFGLQYALIKAVVFGFLVSSVSCFTGYNTTGGTLEVGQSSTAAVTLSCVVLLFANYMLANILL